MTSVQLDIHLGRSSADSTVKANGEDITSCIQRVTVDCGVGKLTKVTLEAAAFKTAPIDLSGPFMAVPRCGGCVWWEINELPARYGSCAEPSGSLKAGDDGLIATRPDFGCVLFRPKPDALTFTPAAEGQASTYSAGPCDKSPNGQHTFEDATEHRDQVRRLGCIYCGERL